MQNRFALNLPLLLAGDALAGQRAPQLLQRLVWVAVAGGGHVAETLPSRCAQ